MFREMKGCKHPVTNYVCTLYIDVKGRAALTRGGFPPATAQTDLQRLVANTKRGKQASPEQRRAILQAIAALEAECGVADPVESAWLSGSWALLYNGAASVEDDDAWRRSSGEVEGPFLSFFKPLTRNLVSTRGDTQLIDVPGGRVENVAVGTGPSCPSLTVAR